MTTTTTTETTAEVQAPAEVKAAKPRAKRKTFKQVRAAEQVKYEAMLAELANEVNALKEQLDAERATLQAIRDSLFTALKYYSKGHV